MLDNPKQIINKAYYSMMVDLSGRSCVIIGGGVVAERKAHALLEVGAMVTVISPECTAQLEQWGRTGQITLLYQSYQAGSEEIRRAFLLFATTDKPEVNEAVRLEGQAMGKLVNSADDSDRSNFIVPATVRRGKLVLSVSTSGASPAVARKVRQELEQAYGEEYEIYLELLQELRMFIQCIVPDTAKRQTLFRLMLGWELLTWIRSGRFDARAKEELFVQIQMHPTADGMTFTAGWIQEQLV